MTPRRTLTLVALLALAACAKKPAADAAPGMAVTLAPVESKTLPHVLSVSGPVAAFQEMQLGVELSGLRITALNVDVGQSVRKGQVLLSLDHRALDANLAQARASLQVAQANYKRAQTLADSKLVSVADVDSLRAQLAQAQASEATAQLQRDFADLRAPENGVISTRLVQAGQVVSAGSELLGLIRDNRLEWRAQLGEAQLARVHVGDAVRIDYQGAQVQGKIRAVSPGVDTQSRTGTIYADLPKPGALKIGVYVEGRIVTGDGPALVVPSAAVVSRDGHDYVFVPAANGTVTRKRVDTAPAGAGDVEILDGLQLGDQVVVEGAGFLGEGDKVRIVASTQAQGAPAGTQP